MPKTCLLTVGSTRFDPLVHAFLSADSLAALAELGITRVVAQVGDSSLAPAAAPTIRAAKTAELGVQPFGDGDAAQGELVVVRFADDLEAQVGQADLVVSHAGTPCPLLLQVTQDPANTMHAVLQAPARSCPSSARCRCKPSRTPPLLRRRSQGPARSSSSRTRP